MGHVYWYSAHYRYRFSVVSLQIGHDSTYHFHGIYYIYILLYTIIYVLVKLGCDAASPNTAPISSKVISTVYRDKNIKFNQ